MAMKNSVLSPSRPLLDFGAGLLIGLSITVALFAAMEDGGGRLPHDMLLTALAALALAIVLKLSAKMKARRRAVARRAVHPRHPGASDTGWTAEGAQRGATEPRGADSQSTHYKTSRDAPVSAVLRERKAARRDTKASAEGNTGRL
jgi:hypothetical protein